jgi:hypothetical protein
MNDRQRHETEDDAKSSLLRKAKSRRPHPIAFALQCARLRGGARRCAACRVCAAPVRSVGRRCLCLCYAPHVFDALRSSRSTSRTRTWASSSTSSLKTSRFCPRRSGRHHCPIPEYSYTRHAACEDATHDMHVCAPHGYPRLVPARVQWRCDRPVGPCGRGCSRCFGACR